MITLQMTLADPKHPNFYTLGCLSYLRIGRM